MGKPATSCSISSRQIEVYGSLTANVNYQSWHCHWALTERSSSPEAHRPAL
ncbi:hypothetical protein H6F95_00020 [Cyanobacteria bacterium FACHB-471]|nr:hypothetical protein [Cyanobacteria bacterium FACHB-471]